MWSAEAGGDLQRAAVVEGDGGEVASGRRGFERAVVGQGQGFDGPRVGIDEQVGRHALLGVEVAFCLLYTSPSPRDS